MDFTLDSEQTALRDAVRGLLKGYDAEHRRAVTKNDPGFDEGMWNKLAEMGILGLPFPENRYTRARRDGTPVPVIAGAREALVATA